MLKSSEFNNAVPKFTNGNYANNPLDPTNIEEPTMQDYVRGVEPLETLPAQWWNWLCNQFTSRFNKLNTYVKNIFDELTQLLSLVNVTPDGTESTITTGQLKNAFKELYPTYVSNKLELGTTYVKRTTTVNGHALSSNVTVSKSDVGLGNVPNVTTNNQTPTYTVASSLANLTSGEVLSTAFGKLEKAVSSLISHINNTNNPHSVTKAQVGLGSVVNTGDSATPIENGTTKFTTGGAYTLKKDLTDIAESLPTDAVLHYSFDEVPDYPDGTATLRHLNDFTTTAGFDTAGQGVLSVANGELINTVTNGVNAWIRKPTTTPSGIVKIKVRATKDCDIRLMYYVNSNYAMLSQIQDAKAGQSYTITSFLPVETPLLLIFGVMNQATDFQLILTDIYIGDGSYSTPIIDNDNGEWNSVGQSGVAVQGVSGKGLKCFNGNYVPIYNFSLNKNFSVSLWVKPENITTNLRGELFRGAGQLIIRNGENGLNKFCVYLWQSSSPTEFQSSDLLPSSEWTHIVVIKNGSVLQVYKNGIRSNNFTLPNDNLQEPTENNYTVANSSNTRPQSFDDLLIFDRALSNAEVMALYQNKANTPKYYGEVPVTRKINGYTLEEDVTLTKTDFGLENVVNTGDSATPISGGTTKFTTGGAYTELAKKVDKTTTVNGYALSGNVTVTKADLGLGNVANKDLSNVVNTGDSATPVSGGTTKFTTGGAYTELNKKFDKTSAGDQVTYSLSGNTLTITSLT